jgi:SNARE associated Golgi protein
MTGAAHDRHVMIKKRLDDKTVGNGAACSISSSGSCTSGSASLICAAKRRRSRCRRFFRPPRADPGDWVERKAGGLLKQLIDGIDAEGWRFVAFVRLVPLFPFNLSNYALGLTRIPLQHYVIATLVAWSPVQLPILGLVTLDAGR